ncbi:MAG: CPXCG motif-containing cysteine-rich protein [Salinisphaera sp.]|nr:CPXCG motif-containing cysteine-rich protein [Salinisphaera sp.]
MLDETFIACPCCGETIHLLIDCSAGEASYIEDCAVCCRPIRVDVHTDGAGGLAAVTASAEDG